jgi:hypothetical protein
LKSQKFATLLSVKFVELVHCAIAPWAVCVLRVDTVAAAFGASLWLPLKVPQKRHATTAESAIPHTSLAFPMIPLQKLKA